MRKILRVAEEWRYILVLHAEFSSNPLSASLRGFTSDPLFRNSCFLTQKYVVGGLSAKQIAREIFSSKMAVLDALKRFGIPVREPHYNHGHPSQPRFGQKYQKQKLIEHKAEKRIVSVVKDLSQKGFSLRQIARILSGMQIPTKCKSKRWHPEMVRRILLHFDFTDN